MELMLSMLVFVGYVLWRIGAWHEVGSNNKRAFWAKEYQKTK